MFRKIEKRINNSHEPVKLCFWCLVICFVFCFASYGYFVRGSIVNIVARQSMEAELSSLSSKVSDLESQYIKAKNSITPELAVSLGFVAPSVQKFVTRDTKSFGLSLINTGI